MDELFNHPLFFLIHVDVNRMSLVKPFGNKEMQKDIIGRGYRCISHLWGTADKAEDHIWRDHGISGIAWNVETRVEKRERLLQIFRYHEGYFWMDNLCMDQNVDPRDKPLEIMGDIYKKCRECICMLDYVWTSDRFKSEADEVEWMIEDVKLGHTPDPLGAYIQNVPRSRWHDRVWTWQEVVLPERIKFISEQANGHEYRPLSAYMFTKIGENMVSTTDVSHYKNSFRRLMMTITETVSLPATNIVETLKEIKRSPGNALRGEIISMVSQVFSTCRYLRD